MLRTVTFSDKTTAAVINGSFISSWISRDMKFHSCDLTEEKRIHFTAADIYASGNICTFWMTPEMEVLHYVAGHYSPAFFRDEIKFVMEIAKEVLDDKNQMKKDADISAKYRALHQARADKRKKDVKAISQADSAPKSPKWDSDPNKEARDEKQDLELRKINLVEGLRYLGEVSTQLSKYAEKNKSLVKLPAVITSYHAGNLFGEGKPHSEGNLK